MVRLDGQVAVVTGAGTGIGRAIALELARHGAAVVIADIDEEAARRTAGEAASAGVPSRAVRADVTRAEDWRALVQATLAELGRIDILCNNAGVSTMNRVVEMSEEEWDFNFAVNAKGVFLGVRAVLPHMIRAGRGRIVNIASMAGLKGVPLLAHYAASKWAVVGFTKSVAQEVAEYGITVNAVCPGYVRTSMQEREVVWEAQLRGMSPEAVRAEYIAKTPLGRLEEPEDVARVVLFLVSPYADFITGAAIPVTGGADLV